MKNRLSYDEIMNKYKDKFYIHSELEEVGGYISLYFHDKDDDTGYYFVIYGRWYSRKREIEYDETEFNKQINAAILKIKQKRLKKKLRQIKKDF